MVEPFRFCSGRTFSRIEIAKHIQSHPVHVCIHRLDVPQKQCLDKLIIISLGIHKPVPYHVLEHQFHFPIGQCQRILWIGRLQDTFVRQYFQIPTCKQKTPDRTLSTPQLIIHNLFINGRLYYTAFYQCFKLIKAVLST